MNILFLTTVLPRKKRMGSEAASQTIIDELIRSGHTVYVVGYVRSNDDYVVVENEICVERRSIETQGAGLQSVRWLAQSFTSRLPYSIAKYRSRKYIETVRGLLKRNEWDLVILDHVQTSWLIDAAPIKLKTIGIAHNVEYQMYKNFAQSSTNLIRRWIYQREVHLLKQIEHNFAHQVEQIWALTRNDADVFAAMPSKAVIEIPLPPSARIKTTEPGNKQFDIGLVGSWTWEANQQGLKWFIQDVCPKLPEHIKIRVAGSGADWLRGRYTNIDYVGFVDDVQVFLRGARVIAIPTLSGGGIQIKTLDAIASCSMIVATPLALRGIQDYPTTVHVATSRTEFATLLSNIISQKICESPDIALIWIHRRCNEFREALANSLRKVTLVI